jgi:hypothetical protein
MIKTINISKDVLYVLYVNRRLSTKKISEMYGCSDTTIWRLLKKNSITYKMQRESYLIDGLMHDIIIGSIFGDGTVAHRSGNTSVAVSHSEDQKDYCQKKLDILKEVCPYTKVIKKERENDTDSTKRKNQFYFTTRFIPRLNRYGDMSNFDLVNNLNINSFIIWFLDDGHKYKPRGTNKREFYELAVQWLNKKEFENKFAPFNVNATLI